MHGTMRLHFIVYEINLHHVKAVGGALLLPHAAMPEEELLGMPKEDYICRSTVTNRIIIQWFQDDRLLVDFVKEREISLSCLLI
jgi:hypothetical protein